MSSISQEQNRNTKTMLFKSGDIGRIRGTKISFKNAQLLTSIGVPTFDNYLGGGLAIGTLIVVEEDIFSTSSNILLKQFLAEGVANSHSIFLASGDLPPEKILKELPTTITTEKTPQISGTDEKLKIAWRYQNQRRSTATTTSARRRFDFGKMVSADDLEKCHIKSWNVDDHQCLACEEQKFMDEPYLNLLQEIKNKIESGEFETTKDAQHQNILRIAVCSIGSPSWHLAEGCKDKEYNIPKFLYGMRSLLRSAYAVAMITIPRILCQDAKLLNRISQMADTVVCLESFQDTSKSSNPMFKEFSGLLHVTKLPVLNSFVYRTPPSDLAYKLWRRNLVIEKLHLPPDLSGPEGSSQESQSLLCCSNTNGSNPLDF